MSIESQKIEIKRRFEQEFEIEFIEEKQTAFIPDIRPLFDSMLKRLIKREKVGLIAWHPDRLSRNEIDGAKITYALRSGKIGDLKFCSYEFHNTPEGIMHLQSALSHSQYESAKKAVDVKREMIQKCERGWYPDTAPNGYKNVLGDIEGEPIIIPDEMRFAMVRRAIDLILSRSCTPNQARKVLNDDWGYLSLKIGKKGNRPISYGAWYKMLNNHFYFGQFRWAGKYYRGKHRPMLTPEEFDELQKILGRKGRPRPKKHNFAFSGSLKCNSCDFSVVFESKSKFVKSLGRVKCYIIGHCTHKSREVICPDRVNLNEEDLITQIKAKISTIEIHPLLLQWALDSLDENLPQRTEAAIATKEAIEKSLLQAREAIKNLVRMRSLNQIDDALFEETKSGFASEVERLEGQQQSHDSQSDELWLELTRRTLHFSRAAMAKLGSGSMLEKRQVLLGFCHSPKLDYGKLIAEPNKWFIPIQRWNEVNGPELRRLEPTVSGSRSNNKAGLEALRISWCRMVSEVRTIFESQGNSAPFVPDFSAPDNDTFSNEISFSEASDDI